MIEKESDLKRTQDIYFAALEKSLRDVPTARRAEFIGEVRAHLHAMWEAKRADGLDAEAAWLHSTAEFGEPEKVGRELRAQWANSGQMETEGEPLPLRRKIRMFALPLLACVAAYAVLTWIGAPQNAASWRWPVTALFIFGCIAYGISSEVRARGGWKPSTLVGCVSAVVIASNSLLHLSGHQIGSGAWRDWGLPIFVLTYTSLYFWLRKRERAERPWQWSARYKDSPVAAEQAYRLSPIVGLAMGATLGCIGMISVGLQFFGLPAALFSCAVLISGAVVLGRWLQK